ncbi:MAG: RNA-binding protein [Xanthobacteraceae bacterium]|nr:RNA-binding protein [Xanthobacteraceae bacterium]
MFALADTTDLDHGPRAKPGAGRMCVVSRQVKDIDDLIRFVVAPTGEVVPDVRRKLPGRGLWVSLSRNAVNEAARRALFAKGFAKSSKKTVTVPPDLAGLTETLLARSALEALAIAAKSGTVVSGFGKVEDAITGRQAVALLHAAEGSRDGIRKLDAKWAAGAGDSPVSPAIETFTGDELDLALGRSNVIHAALLSGPATKTFLTRWQTLERFRHADSEARAQTDKTN